jgi:hypothetical protein
MTDVTATSFTLLNNDIIAADQLTTGSYTITIQGTITATADLTAIDLDAGVSLTINTAGGGGTLSGNGLYRGLFVYQGDVTVENLTITSAVALGGAGVGGGGAGLGGGLFVAGTTDGAGNGGVVTLDDVNLLRRQRHWRE